MVFGASYGGTLAALFRRKFPHLADAAVALSAPMYRDYQNKGLPTLVLVFSVFNRLFSIQIEWSISVEYLPSIGKKIKRLDRKCYMQIEHGLKQAARLMENHICSKKEYTLCDRIRENLG